MVLLCGFLFVDEPAGKKGLVQLQHTGGFKVSAVIGLSSSLFAFIIATKMDNDGLSSYYFIY